MEDPKAILAELEQARQATAGLIRAKLDAVAMQIQELASRAVGELSVVLPQDPEVLFPLGAVLPRLEELARPVLPPPPPPQLSLATLRTLDAGRAQSEVLQELLRQLGQWCGPRAIVVMREGAANGWAGAGFDEGDPSRGWHVMISESPALTRAADGTPSLVHPGGDSIMAGWLGAGQPILVVPMSLRGKVVGALVARAAENGFDAALVQALTFIAGLLLETLTARAGAPTPSLADVGELAPAPEAAPTLPAVEEPVFAPAAEEPVPLEEPAPPPEVAEEDASATVHLKVPVAGRPVVRPPEEERKHEEAKRFARLLVSEIRLYNEQAVQAGKANRDVYQRLKEDIDRSREMYEQRVSSEIRAGSNYFHDELVRILADGDPDALGL